jgi:hypothetical protein
VALDYDLSLLSENEIQETVWHSGREEGSPDEPSTENETTETLDAQIQDHSTSDESSDSEDESQTAWMAEFEESKRRIEEQWDTYQPGDAQAEPHSDEWNKANFLKSRDYIELLVRRDGMPIQPDEIRHTIAPIPLDDKAHFEMDREFRVVIIDLGFAVTFDECKHQRLRNVADFRCPEALLNLQASHKVDIFSAGLLLWEVVMLRRLVETRYEHPDPDRLHQRNRLLHDLAQRLGPIPGSLKSQWPDAMEYVDSDGNALDMQERDEVVYEPEDFEYGDIWHQARRRKPLDMSDSEMQDFVHLIQDMLRWEPETRPSTGELLRYTWFNEM